MDNSIPDIYCDGVQVNLTLFDAILTFMKRSPNLGSHDQKPTAHIRMATANAKVLAMSLRKLLKTFEEQHGEISLPQAVWQQLGLSPQEDW